MKREDGVVRRGNLVAADETFTVSYTAVELVLFLALVMVHQFKGLFQVQHETSKPVPLHNDCT